MNFINRLLYIVKKSVNNIIMEKEEDIDIRIETLNDNILATTVTGSTAGSVLGATGGFIGAIIGGVIGGSVGYYSGYMNRKKRRELIKLKKNKK